MTAILGGGLAGLSTGYYLLRNCVNTAVKSNIILYEAETSCGGWIKSINTADYLFEQGPRTIRPRGTIGLNTLNMVEDLGLSQHVVPILPDHPAAKNRMIYVNNTLHKLPSNLFSLFMKKTPFSKPLIYAILNDLKQPLQEMKDDSIYNFSERRFGKEIADYAVSPMICGICAGDAKEISVKFLMKSLFDYEQNDGGVVRGVVKSMFKSKSHVELDLSELAQTALDNKWSVYTLKGGLEILTEKLKADMIANNVLLRMSTKIEEIEFVNPSTVLLRMNAFDSFKEAHHIYSGIPAYSLANLVQRQHPDLANDLKQIPFVNVGIVNLFYATKEKLISPGFGFLVPPKENCPILGVVFDSCCTPNENGTVLTVMLGGKWFKDRFGDDVTKDKLLQIAVKEVETILRIKMKPTASHTNILEKCIPQYIVGHYDRVEKMREYILKHNLPLSLVGCSYDGVGINDVIYSAKKQVEKDCT